MSCPTTIELKWHDLLGDSRGRVAMIEFNRPQFANALNKEMILELTDTLKELVSAGNCRALVITGKGRHFSAGADLKWMQASASLSEDENKKELRQLGELFETLNSLPLPTIAVVKGATFGGAVGLLACCDISIVSEAAQFCLSEVRLGLLPAVILPFLKQRMHAGALRRLCLSAEVFSAGEARQYGLIDKVVPTADLGGQVQTQLDCILAGGSKAQSSVKKLLSKLSEVDLAVGVSLGIEAIAQARRGDEGQEGLAAFIAKRPAEWFVKFDEALDFS